MSGIEAFLRDLREEIIEAFQSYEAQGLFERKCWNYERGRGGGEIALLRGEVFEKGAVNFSKVEGEEFPGSDGEGPFLAMGISLITHMANPHAPTVHMNLRYLETKKANWFGGGYDLTPMGFPYEEDSEHFHASAKRALDPFGEELYPAFREAAKEYFYIPHRKRERGEGGLFFDHYNTGEFDRDFSLWQEVGRSFLGAILPIYDKRIHQPFTKEDKALQHLRRGHYAEFNLIYDRGTRFGLLSGGNPEAIFCSLPPTACW